MEETLFQSGILHGFYENEYRRKANRIRYLVSHGCLYRKWSVDRHLHVRRNTIEIEFEKELDEMKDSIVITKMSMDVCSDVKKCFQCVPWPQ